MKKVFLTPIISLLLLSNQLHALSSKPEITVVNNDNAHFRKNSFYITAEIGPQWDTFADVESATPETYAVSKVIDNRDHSFYSGLGLGYRWAETQLSTEIMYRTVNQQSFENQQVWYGGYNGQPDGWAEQTNVQVIKQELIMLNLLYDFKIQNNEIKPYLGIGAGISKTKVAATQFDATPELAPLAFQPWDPRTAYFSDNPEINFTWEVVGGVNYQLSKNIDLGIGYRYNDAGKISTAKNCSGNDIGMCDVDEHHKAKLRAHNIFMKINYNFSG